MFGVSLQNKGRKDYACSNVRKDTVFLDSIQDVRNRKGKKPRKGYESDTKLKARR